MAEKLRLHQVGKTFTSRAGSLRAIDGIDLMLADGEFISVVGASGCGKSTLLRIVAGLQEATDGELEVDGRRLDGPGKDRVMVFQQYTLYPWLSAQKNIEFGLIGVPRRERADIARRH